jgi:hypothetical protein
VQIPYREWVKKHYQERLQAGRGPQLAELETILLKLGCPKENIPSLSATVVEGVIARRQEIGENAPVIWTEMLSVAYNKGVHRE